MTIRSLAEHLNLSNATVQKCINSLVEKDLILKKQSMHENGIGLKNVKKIVESYNGNMEIHMENDIFSVNIILYMSQI
mgnify:FL=1